jgi:hypothetical protein
VRLLVSGNTDYIAGALANHPDRFGVLATPRGGHRLPGAGAVWACDNDCFTGLKPVPWLRFLARLVEHKESRPRFVTCPDAVGDMAETWRLYDTWSPVMRSLGLPVALVLQDGLEQMRHRARLPWVWDEIAAVFVGGSTAFKEGDFAADVVTEAKRRGLHVHCGRCTTERRIKRFVQLGADSADGAAFSRWSERLAEGVRWVDRAIADRQRQGRLFAA